MAFVRWNETTHIWEKSSNPDNPSAGWNNLPLQKLIIGEGVDTGLPLQVRGFGQANSLSINTSSNIARYYSRQDDPLTPTVHNFYIRDGVNSGVDQRNLSVTAGGVGIFNDLTIFAGGTTAGNIVAAGTISERQRVTPLGEWKSYIPTIAGGSFTVSLGDRTGQYTLVGRTMIVCFTINGFTITGANPAIQQEIHISIPVPIISLNNNVGTCILYHDASLNKWISIMAYGINTESVIRCLANFNNASGSYLWGTVILPI